MFFHCSILKHVHVMYLDRRQFNTNVIHKKNSEIHICTLLSNNLKDVFF